MLKFDSWPPKTGEVHFSDGTRQLFRDREQAQRDLSESDATITPIYDVAYAAGSLIRANTDPFTARRIGQELLQLIDNGNIRELFAPVYERGVQVEDEAIAGVVK